MGYSEKRGLPAPIWLPGGKGNMIFKLPPLVPYGDDVRIYAEPYCGAASLFFAKKPHPIDVLNDLDQRLIGLFRTLQDPEKFSELKHRLLYTPYARAEFERGDAPLVDQAWALFVARNQAFGGNMTSWGRVLTRVRGGIAGTVNSWLFRLSFLDEWHRRLMMAQIDCVDALEFIEYWDTEQTFFYIDPPYHPDTWAVGTTTILTVDREHHRRLVQILLGLKGLALLSGYYHPDYAPLEERGWHRYEFRTAGCVPVRSRRSGLRGAGSARKKVPRTESLWISPRLARRLGLSRGRTLFDLWGGSE